VKDVAGLVRSKQHAGTPVTNRNNQCCGRLFPMLAVSALAPLVIEQLIASFDVFFLFSLDV
jgi:hypothetical protein